METRTVAKSAEMLVTKIASVCRDIEELPISSSQVSDRVDSNQPLVIVTGMHRSGTSAAAGTLTYFGVSTTLKEDLIPSDEGNRTGYFESRLLALLNDSVLEALGGSWEAPPESISGCWLAECTKQICASSRNSQRLQLALRTALAAVTTGASVEVWKDPRLSLLLSGWRKVIGRKIVMVIVFREPIETARSLFRRDGMPIDQGLALWETYNRKLLTQIEPAEALFCRYSAMVTEPDAWTAQIGSFFSRNGIRTPDQLPLSRVRGFLRPEIHADARSETVASALSRLTLEVFDQLEEYRKDVIRQ